jgi:hypothetical protein
MANPTVEALIAARISRTHAYDIIAGREEPSLAVALRIYSITREKFGLLKGLSEETIAELQRKAAAS